MRRGRPGHVPAWDGSLSRRSLLKGMGAGALALGAADSSRRVSSGIKGSGGGSAGTITIGFVTRRPAQLAGFASGDNFVVDQIRATDVYKNGFKVGGKTYTVEIVVKD